MMGRPTFPLPCFGLSTLTLALICPSRSSYSPRLHLSLTASAPVGLLQGSPSSRCQAARQSMSQLSAPSVTMESDPSRPSTSLS